MGTESTRTELDLDTESLQFIKTLRVGGPEVDMDLDVDGYTDSIIGRLRQLFSFGRV